MHTPLAVATAMVREADALLARHGLPRLGARGLEIVDPATGPGVFLAATIAHARADGAPLVGIDVDAEAFVATRTALGVVARARGWELVLAHRDALAGPHETRAASLLIVGNPPWSARGLGPAYVEGLVRDFHVDEHGAPLRERRRGVLADAYIRFVRWAADAIARAPGGGAIALVTSSSYLDGPVHRGVRAFLASACDEVSIVDLGGSALVGRVPGTLDENVFGVRPGAAILLAARGPGAARRARASTSYGVVRGTVSDKLAALAHPVARTPVHEPLASLRPRAATPAAYAGWPSLADIFPFHAEGIQTNRDELVVDVDRDALLARLEAFARGRIAVSARPHFDPKQAARAVAALVEAGALEAHVACVAYRPFDTRWAFLHPSLCHRPRPPLGAAMACARSALVSVRQDRGGLPWAHAALVGAPIDNCYLSARSSCRARAFPSHGPDGAPNLAPVFTRALASRGIEASPDEVVAYVGAVLASPSYARAFAPALALDYPRVPWPSDRSRFARLVSLGGQLAALLASSATPVRARAGREVVRVGHHAFDPEAPTSVALTALRASLDEAVAEVPDPPGAGA